MFPPEPIAQPTDGVSLIVEPYDWMGPVSFPEPRESASLRLA